MGRSIFISGLSLILFYQFFYQLKGDMCLKVVENGKHKDVHIKEGEVGVCVHVWLGACTCGWVCALWLGACLVSWLSCICGWVRACVHVWFGFGVSPDYASQIKSSIKKFPNNIMMTLRAPFLEFSLNTIAFTG